MEKVGENSKGTAKDILNNRPVEYSIVVCVIPERKTSGLSVVTQMCIIIVCKVAPSTKYVTLATNFDASIGDPRSRVATSASSTSTSSLPGPSLYNAPLSPSETTWLKDQIQLYMIPTPADSGSSTKWI